MIFKSIHIYNTIYIWYLYALKIGIERNIIYIGIEDWDFLNISHRTKLELSFFVCKRKALNQNKEILLFLCCHSHWPEPLWPGIHVFLHVTPLDRKTYCLHQGKDIYLGLYALLLYIKPTYTNTIYSVCVGGFYI